MRNMTVTYMKCQSCAAKVNCHECDAYLRDDLGRVKSIQAVEVNMKQKLLSLETQLDDDELEEVLEDRGLFI